jgi:uncharacterized protein YjiS (DUF1127 family)
MLCGQPPLAPMWRTRDTAINAIWSAPMSMIFRETLTLPPGPPAGRSLVLHQLNSWNAIAPGWAFRRWTERRTQRRTLGEMAGDRHLLDDIGLTRVQALREAAKPFWRA